MKHLIDRLRAERRLSRQEYSLLLAGLNDELLEYANAAAREVAGEWFGNRVYKRGLIEVTNYCRNDCYYCGIRKSNPNVERYRMTEQEILDSCRTGYELGFRSFVLQGGEDAAMNDDFITSVVAEIRRIFQDCAITLSLGERSMKAYERFFDAGANRYLLRHETADPIHYSKLHPSSMSFDNRVASLRSLKEIGYQAGTGMMVGSPGQTVGNLVEDIVFIQEFEPQMIGLGPYIPQHDTPFAGENAGSTELTLLLISIFRLMFPKALIPSTTSIATLSGDGRERGILAGANVVMPNLTPQGMREKYTLYDNKKHSGSEAAEGLRELEDRIASIGYRLTDDRGDYGVKYK